MAGYYPAFFCCIFNHPSAMDWLEEWGLSEEPECNSEYADNLARRRSQVDAIERGLLEREIYITRAI